MIHTKTVLRQGNWEKRALNLEREGYTLLKMDNEKLIY